MREETREERDERRKGETSTTNIRKEIEGCNDSIPEWRDGTEKGRSLGEEGRVQREARREKRETSTTKISRSKDAMVRSQNGGMVQ